MSKCWTIKHYITWACALYLHRLLKIEHSDDDNDDEEEASERDKERENLERVR